MISVRWQGQNDPHHCPVHGWDFETETSKDMCRFNKGERECIDWKEYVFFYAFSGPALRIWVNGTVVWDWERGWYSYPLITEDEIKVAENILANT